MRGGHDFEPALAPAERLRILVAAGRAACADTAVFVVADLKGDHTLRDIHDISTEHLSEAELDQIVGGFRDAGVYCDAFIDAAEFCRWACAGGSGRFPFSRRGLYSIAQPGSGASRHAPLAGVAALFGMALLTPAPYEACLSAHKPHAGLLISAQGVRTPQTWVLDPKYGWSSQPPPENVTVIVKPGLESASIGLDESSRFNWGPASADHVLHLAEALSQPMVVQQFIPGREVEVAILDDGEPFALEPVGIALDGRQRLDDRFLDYQAVNADAYTFYDFGALDAEVSCRLRRDAATAARALGVGGISRFDFRVTDSGESFLIDMTGKPHLTRHSSVAFRFATLGLAYADVFAALLGTAAFPHAAGDTPSRKRLIPHGAHV